MKGEKNRLNKLRHELRMWLTELLYAFSNALKSLRTSFIVRILERHRNRSVIIRDQYLINTKFMNRDEVEIHKKHRKERDLTLIKSVIICFTM